jgi:hypothetical protein
MSIFPRPTLALLSHLAVEAVGNVLDRPGVAVHRQLQHLVSDKGKQVNFFARLREPDRGLSAVVTRTHRLAIISSAVRRW